MVNHEDFFIYTGSVLCKQYETRYVIYAYES